MSMWLKAALVASGGAVGALLRWGIAEAMLRFSGAAPLGTLAANLIGCFFIGVAKAAVDSTGWGSPEVRIFVFTGLLGAFTTFSTFEADTFSLWKLGERAWAVTYLFGSVAGGLCLFLAGWFLTERLAQ